MNEKVYLVLSVTIKDAPERGFVKGGIRYEYEVACSEKEAAERVLDTWGANARHFKIGVIELNPTFFETKLTKQT